jgi:serine/threonine protein kinase
MSSRLPDEKPGPALPGEATSYSTVAPPGRISESDPKAESTRPPETTPAPSFGSLVDGSAARVAAWPRPEPGQRLDDFELLRVLGKGSFATVFLARQVSLDRLVALKVSANCGREARTLASLEHGHIVQVFSEVVDRQRNLRLMSMQYVPGTTLDRVIRLLGQRRPQDRDGRAIVSAIDSLSHLPTTFDPAALRDRETLSDCDSAEAVCWLGARLAEALAYAHGQGVLHRDVKPANILLNSYGRPMLADFNVAHDPRPAKDGQAEVFGGTLTYMAPEHLDALTAATALAQEAVDQRSDIYSLALVLFELLTGKRPFGHTPPDEERVLSLEKMAEERRSAVPSARALLPDLPEVLDRVLRRCLEPEPARRYSTAAELARALEGCRELRRVEKDMPAAGPLTRAIQRHPIGMLVALVLVPHLVGSVVNIAYNSLRIMSSLTPAQQATFNQLVLGYNLAVYPLCLVALYLLLAPLLGLCRRLDGPEPVADSLVTSERRRALTLPSWVIALSCVGWLPGGLLFPLALDWFSGPLGPDVIGHFLVSFTISGLIALTYSVFGAQLVVLRGLYPRFWTDAQDLRPKVRRELRPLGRRLAFFQLLAGLIPLSGAALLVGMGPEQFTSSSYQSFRFLVTALIALGIMGFGVALSASRFLNQTLTAFVGAERAAAG